MIAGRFVVDARLRANTYYGVTDQRVLIVSGLVNRSVKSLNLRTLSDITLEEKAGRGGTILFGPPPYAAWGWNMWRPGMPSPVPSFELVDNTKQVFEIIKKAQLAAA